MALPARTDVLLEFYFTAPYLLELQATGTCERAPRVAAVGPQTFRRVDLILSGRLDIHFILTGLYELLGVPMPELTDVGLDGAALFGGQFIGDLQDRLAAVDALESRVRIADDFILARLAGCEQRRANPVVVHAVARMKQLAGGGSI